MAQIPGLTIIEEYISEAEEKELIDFINTQPWLSALSRRVQHYGYEYAYRAPYGLKNAPPIPDIFQRYMDGIDSSFDQAIVNEYTPGQGIGKHTDNKHLFGERIASISLGAATSMVFALYTDETEFYIQPRTLIIMEDEARWKYTHQIPARKADLVNGEKIPRGTRLSVTFRTTKNSVLE